MLENPYQQIAMQAGSVFTPGSPVNERDLFAGRVEQLDKILAASSQRGYHAVLYGERGVGKTSLANVLSGVLSSSGWIAPRVNCDGSDTYASVWRKALRDIVITRTTESPGFESAINTSYHSIVEGLPVEFGPDDVRRTAQTLGAGVQLLIIFDEFDRLADREVSVLMADTIKAFSDYSVPATILLIGVADSVDQLVEGHHSIERAIVQIPMPRMSAAEIAQIVENGLRRLGMNADKDAVSELVALSQGLPYITHLLSLESVKAALGNERLTVTAIDVTAGIKRALEQWQHSIVSAYYDATKSSQPGNIYKEVFLACALADMDEMGYFTASSVRAPLRMITGRDYDIPNFAQHLKNFSESGRGGMLERTGEKRRIRYRFTSPLIRPYVIMRGFSENMINRKQMQQITYQRK